MYPECRHVRPSGDTCRAAALAGSHWCYFHARLHQRQTIRHTNRQSDGRFAPLAHLDRGPRLAPRPQTEERLPHPEQSEEWDTTKAGSALQTIDYGTYPVDTAHPRCHPEQSEGPAVGPHSHQSLPLELPPIEDTESIQLALIDVVQALAANRIDTKRAGLLLYALQVASANAKHINIPSHGVRTVSYTSDGIALAPQDYGWDLEDIQEEIDYEDAGEDEADEDEG
jgi:hypothetical protein